MNRVARYVVGIALLACIVFGLRSGARADYLFPTNAVCTWRSMWTRTAQPSRSCPTGAFWCSDKLSNYTRDYPQGLGTAPTIGWLKLFRPMPLPGEDIVVSINAGTDGMAGDQLEKSAQYVYRAEIDYSMSTMSWYENLGGPGPGIPMDYFTSEKLLARISGQAYKTYESTRKPWTVSHVSGAWDPVAGGDPSPERLELTRKAGYKGSSLNTLGMRFFSPIPFAVNEPCSDGTHCSGGGNGSGVCPYALDCQIYNNYPLNSGRYTSFGERPLYAGAAEPPAAPTCTLGDLNCNVPGFPVGGGDILDGITGIDPDPIKYPMIPGEPLIRVNGVPAISCDLYNGEAPPGSPAGTAVKPLHPMCVGSKPPATTTAYYNYYGIYSYKVTPSQGLVNFRQALQPSDVVDATFYMGDRSIWTTKMDTSKSPLNGWAGFYLYPQVWDTCGNVASGHRSNPPKPTFAPTTNENLYYMHVEDNNWDQAPTDNDPLVQLNADAADTQCSATDTRCPKNNVPPVSCNAEPGCECCYNECTPTTCDKDAGYDQCHNYGDSGNPVGCGPEFNQTSGQYGLGQTGQEPIKKGMGEIQHFRIAHSADALYFKMQTRGDIIFGCYGGWYPLIGCEVYNFFGGGGENPKLSAYAFQIVNNKTTAAFYLIIVPEIPIYGSLTLWIDLEELKSGGLGSNKSEMEYYAEGGGCKKPGDGGDPAPDPCEAIGCAPASDPNGDCDGDGFPNNNDSCPCENGGADSQDGCSPPSPPSSTDKFSCKACKLEVSGNKMYVELTRENSIKSNGLYPVSAFAMTVGLHALSIDDLMYKACLKNYSLASLGTDRSPTITYYTDGDVGRSTVSMGTDKLPPDAPVITACLGTCAEPASTTKGFDPTARRIEVKWRESMFNYDGSDLVDLRGYQLQVARSLASVMRDYYTICNPSDGPECMAGLTSVAPKDRDGNPVLRTRPSDDDPYNLTTKPGGERFPKPFDDRRALQMRGSVFSAPYGYPGEFVSCIVDYDCDPKNGIDDDKNGVVDDQMQCAAPTCMYDGSKELAEDGQTYVFQARSYDTASPTANFSPWSSRFVLTVLRNTTKPAPPGREGMAATQTIFVYPMSEGRAEKVTWPPNYEPDMGAYAIYRCPSRTRDAITMEADGTLADYCSHPENYRRVNKLAVTKDNNYFIDYGDGFYERGDEDGDWVDSDGDHVIDWGEPGSNEWIDCSSNAVQTAKSDLKICGNVSDDWATGTALFDSGTNEYFRTATGSLLYGYSATDTTRPVLYYNGLVDGYSYYYRLRAVDSPYDGDGSIVRPPYKGNDSVLQDHECNYPGNCTCDNGKNPYSKKATQGYLNQGCVNPIDDTPVGWVPQLKGRQCDDPTIKNDWVYGGNCSDMTDPTISVVAADTLEPPKVQGLGATVTSTGKAVSLTWQDLKVADVTVDHYNIYRRNSNSGVFACVHDGCGTKPYVDGCKCDDATDCNSGRMCVAPIKVCTDADGTFNIKPDMTNGCGTLPLAPLAARQNDGCACETAADCKVDGNNNPVRSCDFAYKVCSELSAPVVGQISLSPANMADDDGDGLIGEDPLDGVDNDGDGLLDEDISTNNPGAGVVPGMCPKKDPLYAVVTKNNSFLDESVEPGKTYYYTVTAVDNAIFDPAEFTTNCGARNCNFRHPPYESARSDVAVVTTRDTDSPSVPVGLCNGNPCVTVLESENIYNSDTLGNRLTLTWTANSDVDLQGYKVYRAEDLNNTGQMPNVNQFQLITPAPIPRASGEMIITYRDSGLYNDVDYYYAVTAVDKNNNESGYSGVAGPGRPKDTVAPSSPGWEPKVDDNSRCRIEKGLPDCSGSTAPPACCTVTTRHDCPNPTWGAQTNSIGNMVTVTWSAQSQTVCNNTYSETGNNIAARESDFTGFNVYRSEDVPPACSSSTTASCTTAPGAPCRLAAGILDTVLTDRTVVSGRTYNYCLTAVDKAGNESAISELRTVTPMDTAPPDVPDGVVATALSAGSIAVGWATQETPDLAGFRVWRSATRLENSFQPAALISTIPGYRLVNPDGIVGNADDIAVINGLGFTDTGLFVGATYYYRVTAVDILGHESGKSEIVSATARAMDNLPPGETPFVVARPGYDQGESTALRFNGSDDDGDGLVDDGAGDSSANEAEGQVQLFWGRVADPDITSYQVYRLDPPTATCTQASPDNTPYEEATRKYKLIKEITKEQACPAAYHAHPAGVISAETCRLNDANNPIGLCNGSRYWYYVTAKDLAGNINPVQADKAIPATPKIKPVATPPATPSQPIVYAPPTGGRLSVKFAPSPASTENKYLSGYIILRDTNVKGAFTERVAMLADPLTYNYCKVAAQPPCYCETVDAAKICIADENVLNENRYYYRVQAYDQFGNISGMSNYAFGKPSRSAKPADVTSLSVTATPRDRTGLLVTWSLAKQQAEPSFAGLKLFRSSDASGVWIFVDPQPQTTAQELRKDSSYIDTGLVTGEKYCYLVLVYDNMYKESAGAISCGSPGVDTTPPSPPNGLTARWSGSAAVLSWSSNGEPDLAGYHVYRSEKNSYDEFVRLDAGTGSITTPNFSDTGITSNKNYWFRVSAYDNFGNESLMSGVVTFTAGDGSGGASLRIGVRSGWNMLSLPNTASGGGALSRMTQTAGGNGAVIYTLDGQSYTANEFSARVPVGPGTGFWYYSPDDTELLFEGDYYNEPILEFDLKAGWNLLGNPFSSALQWDDSHALFTTNRVTYLPITEARGSGILKDTQFYTTTNANSGVYQQIPANASIGVGQGFWVKVTQPVTIRLVR